MRTQQFPRRISRLARVGTVVAAVALAAVSLTACGSGGGGAAGGKVSTTLTMAAPNGPLSLDPALNGNGTPLIWYTRLAYDSLIIRDVDGTAKPGLATDWAYSDDRLSFVLNLRKDVKFSDGEELTAQAVVDWLKYYKEHTTFQWMQNVSDIVATGDLQVTITLSSPDPLLPLGLDQEGEAGDVVSPAGLKDPSVLGTETHGAGPYMLDTKATVANSSYVYVKNPNYWDPDSQHYEKVVVKVIADQNSTLAALRSGQVDIAAGSPTAVAAAKSAGLTVTAARSALVGVYLFDINGKMNPAFADVRVRQALNYAIDREGITKTLYLDNGEPTTQYVPEGIDGYVKSLEDEYPYDPEKAKQLLADAGYPNGFSFKMVVQPGASDQNNLSQAVVQQWAKIGVNVTLDAPTAFPDYVTAIGTGEYAATSFNFYYSAQLVDMQQLFTNPALYNFFSYTDQKANDLTIEQRKYDVDSPEGKKAAEESETYVVKNALAVPVAATDTVMLSRDTVTDVDFTSAFPIPDPTKWKPAKK